MTKLVQIKIQKSRIFKTASKNDMSALWTRSKSSDYQDLILTDDLRKFRHRFESGKTKIRILPALQGSSHWMLGIKVLQNPGGRHAHPKTIQPDGQSVFDFAYGFLKGKFPSRLFSRSNKNGFRLLPAPMSLCWAIVEDANGTRLRLLLNSHYDGSRGGSNGLGHLIYDQVYRAGKDCDKAGHPLNPLDGTSLTIERIGGGDTKFPSYRVGLSAERSPLQPLLDKISDMEYEALSPLEKTVRILEPEEEWRQLAKVVGDELKAEIRTAQESGNTEENDMIEIDDEEFPKKWML